MGKQVKGQKKGAVAHKALKKVRVALKAAIKSKKGVKKAKVALVKAKKSCKAVHKLIKISLVKARAATKRVAHSIKLKVHMPKKVTAAFKSKVKKACKFCKENINIVKGKKKLIVIKSHKTIKAKKVGGPKKHGKKH